MEGRAKVTKDVLVEEARFILANVLAEGRYGRQNRVADIRRICEGAVTIPFPEYVGFLEAAGYLAHDHERDTLDVTDEGEKVVTGEKVNELMERAVAHFKASRRERERAVAQGIPTPAPGVPASPPGPLVGPQITAPAAVPQAVPSGPVAMNHAPKAEPAITAAVPAAAPAPVPASGGGMRYEKLGAIGNGGIGTVYRARQLHLEREVALKEVRELFTFFAEDQRREIIRRFAEVVRAAAQLSHPNIVAIHDASTDVAHPFLVSELMSHGSVRRIIADAEDIPVALVVKVLLQVLHALGAAHAAGVIHRGIKPENLLLDAHGNVKVSDFGMGRVVERDQSVIKQVYVGMGTVGYMAPELFHSPGAASPQADIYALGIVFYELLTRKLPGRRSPMPSQVNNALPKGLDDIFDRMTRDEQDERYQSVGEILDDFYKLEGMATFVELHYSKLFVDNLVAGLKFKQPLVPDPPRLPTPSSAADVVGSRPQDPTGQLPVAEGAVGRRPYSYQQRMKNKGE